MAAIALAATAPTPASAAKRYRFVHTPIVTYAYLNGQPVYEALVRLKRAVPRQPNGSPLAGADLEGWGPDLPGSPDERDQGWGFVGRDRGGRHCYAQSFLDYLVPGNPLPERLRRPRPGRRVTLRVFIKGVARPLRSTVPLRRIARPGQDARYAKRLGCA